MTDQNLLLREDGYPHLNTEKGENMSYEQDIFRLAHEAGFQSHALDKNSIIVRHSNGGWVDVTGAVFRFADAIRALPLPEAKQEPDAEALRKENEKLNMLLIATNDNMMACLADKERIIKENEQLVSITKRWLALGGGDWNASTLENDTKAAIAALKGGAA